MSAQIQEQQAIVTPVFEVGQKVAFIFNKEDCLPATIRNPNFNGTYDLVVQTILEETTIDWGANKNFQRVTKIELKPKVYEKVRLTDPTLIFTRTPQKLSDPVVDPARGLSQTHTDTWQPQKQKLQVPRFDNWHTCHVGCFFDPTKWHYRVRAWRASFRDVGGIIIPEVTEFFPKNKPLYNNYEKAFAKYFKERHQNKGKWNLVEITALIPQIKEEVEENA